MLEVKIRYCDVCAKAWIAGPKPCPHDESKYKEAGHVERRDQNQTRTRGKAH